MYYIKGPFFTVVWLFVQISFSQEDFVGYWEPEVALNYKVSTNYSHNFSMDLRSYTYETNTLQLSARHMDVSHFSKFSIGAQQSIALGVMYRFREVFENNRQNELRFTQQYNITHKTGNIRLGNRLRTEQRIRTRSTIHRFRYRFALDVPLQGEELDVGEPYLVASTESLLSISKGDSPEWDQRLTTNLGWLINTNTKIQTGLEYRAENYTRDLQHVLFLLSSLVFSL